MRQALVRRSRPRAVLIWHTTQVWQPINSEGVEPGKPSASTSVLAREYGAGRAPQAGGSSRRGAGVPAARRGAELPGQRWVGWPWGSTAPLIAHSAGKADRTTEEYTAALLQPKKWAAGLCTPGRPAPFRERRLGCFAAVQPTLKPIQHLGLNPSHSVRAKLYPLGEFTGLFQPRDVLRRVEDQLLELALWKNPHHDVSTNEEHRDAPGYDDT